MCGLNPCHRQHQPSFRLIVTSSVVGSSSHTRRSVLAVPQGDMTSVVARLGHAQGGREAVVPVKHNPLTLSADAKLVAEDAKGYGLMGREQPAKVRLWALRISTSQSCKTVSSCR
jgi:hypothetical protein